MDYELYHNRLGFVVQKCIRMDMHGLMHTCMHACFHMHSCTHTQMHRQSNSNLQQPLSTDDLLRCVSSGMTWNPTLPHKPLLPCEWS